VTAADAARALSVLATAALSAGVVVIDASQPPCPVLAAAGFTYQNTDLRAVLIR
jgi:hypothetical protein